MSGWTALAVLLIAALGLLRLLGLRGAMLQLSAAALLFAAAGYAFQGRPGLEAAPASEMQQAAPIPLTTLRHAFFGSFSGSEHWMVIAESYARRGRTEEAAGVLRSAIREHPRDIALWVGLGNALADHAGMITPASRLAFERAAELAPGHPAAPFFYGLALARSGDREAALALWRAVLADAPADAGWRHYVEDAIRAIDPPRDGEGDRSPQASGGGGPLRQSR